MMDLWSTPTPERQPDRPAGSGEDARSADPTPTGLESVDAALRQGFMAVHGRYGQEVQAAVYEARAAEGPVAYGRYTENPGAFGEVVNMDEHSRLAAALPVRDQTAAYLGIPLPETVGRGPELARDPGIYVSGPRAADFVEMLSARTGLTLLQDGRRGLAVNGPVGPLPQDASGTLRSLVLSITRGEAGQRPVEINAVATSRSVFFDVDGRLGGRRNPDSDTVDMGDFDQASNYPEFQAAQLGHILTERMTDGSYTLGHISVLQVEKDIIQEMTGININVRPSSDSTTPPEPRDIISLGSNLYEARDMFDYGSVVYGVLNPASTPRSDGTLEVHLNEVHGVYRIPSTLP